MQYEGSIIGSSCLFLVFNTNLINYTSKYNNLFYYLYCIVLTVMYNMYKYITS